jgi:hypothetical protein
MRRKGEAMDDQLNRLIDNARDHVMTPEELAAQRAGAANYKPGPRQAMTQNWTPEPWMPTGADMGGGITAAKRVHVVGPHSDDWDWWVGHGKDESCQIEGTPCHWFWLAYLLIGLADHKDRPYSEDKPLPFSKDRVVACVNALAGIADPEAFVQRAKAIEAAAMAYASELPTEEDARNEAALNEGRCCTSTARGLALRAALAMPGGGA